MDFLGVSDRTVEKYTAKGLLTVRYEPGKTRPVATYEEEEVTKLKEKMTTVSETNKTSQQKAEKTKNEVNIEMPSDEYLNTEPNRALILAATKPITAGFEQMAFTIEKLTQTVESIRTNKPPIVPVESKVILTLAEAASLLSMSKQLLVLGIKEGKLKAAKQGRGWKIRRKDLDLYAESLW
ncbi:MAG: hypothetical protein FD167_78 [bacterium]|nr:MAG: hypothetical protein FD167_78 [bacterium]